jgi:hypothetical protein
MPGQPRIAVHFASRPSYLFTRFCLFALLPNLLPLPIYYGNPILSSFPAAFEHSASNDTVILFWLEIKVN